ncbi:MAG: hypothetical protein SVX43_09655, partial [Cyanobacteriota bacterium]|nr:hypothetical protein [Cyanobacteriota bacterium]
MIERHLNPTQIVLPILLSGAFVVGGSLTQSARAHSSDRNLGEPVGTSTLLALRFQSPGDPLPPNSVGGSTRGEV